MKIIQLLFISLLLSTVSTGLRAEKALRKVVIDAGHGGRDPGALTARNKEKDIALSVSLLLGAHIQSEFPDVEVIYTRKTDVYLTLDKRSTIANNANADLFISIHVDAIGRSSVSGATAYVLGLHRSEENLKVAMRENSVLLLEEDYSVTEAGFDPNNPESYIIFSLLQNQHLDNSLLFAGFVDRQFETWAKRKTRGVRQAGFSVLRKVGMPSVLIETGYITNLTEEKYLASKKGQEKIAEAIFRAFSDYKKSLEASTSTRGAKEVQSEEDTYFSIQLLSSSKQVPADSPRFGGYAVTERYIDNTYKYFYGQTQDYAKILSLSKEVRAKIKDAYIVGFDKGKRVTARQVQDILGEKQ